jgi:hypothetical protein
MDVWRRLNDLLYRYDADFKCDVGTGAAWSGTLRLTLTDPPQRPSRSITFHATGGADPEDVAERCLDDADEWLAESDTEPMPVPEWLRD